MGTYTRCDNPLDWSNAVERFRSLDPCDERLIFRDGKHHLVDRERLIAEADQIWHRPAAAHQ